MVAGGAPKKVCDWGTGDGQADAAQGLSRSGATRFGHGHGAWGMGCADPFRLQHERQQKSFAVYSGRLAGWMVGRISILW
jgi:hypothetical protein